MRWWRQLSPFSKVLTYLAVLVVAGFSAYYITGYLYHPALSSNTDSVLPTEAPTTAPSRKTTKPPSRKASKSPSPSASVEPSPSASSTPRPSISPSHSPSPSPDCTGRTCANVYGDAQLNEAGTKADTRGLLIAAKGKTKSLPSASPEVVFAPVTDGKVTATFAWEPADGLEWRQLYLVSAGGQVARLDLETQVAAYSIDANGVLARLPETPAGVSTVAFDPSVWRKLAVYGRQVSAGATTKIDQSQPILP